MSKKILVVDDDPTICKMLATRLGVAGYESLVAQDATLGLEIAFKESPDLIVLDVMMPIINGFNFCRLLKEQELQKKIPIIMLTGRAEEEDIRIGQEVGADAYFVKPPDMNELLNKIEELVNI